MIQRRDVNEVVADPGRDDDVADRETEIAIDEETGIDEADHGKEQTTQKTVEETEADPEKEKGFAIIYDR